MWKGLLISVSYQEKDAGSSPGSPAVCQRQRENPGGCEVERNPRCCRDNFEKNPLRLTRVLKTWVNGDGRWRGVTPGKGLQNPKL